MDPLTPFLDNDGVVILDGALATELERHGADLRDPLWSAKLLLENPDLIRQVHYDYFCAGADVATTASYQATIHGLLQRGLDRQQAADVLRLSVKLAQQARDQFWYPSPSGRGVGGEGVGQFVGLTPPAQHPHPRPLSQGERGARLKTLVAASIGCYGASLHDGSEYRGDYGLSVQQLIDWHRPRLEILAESGADLLACETVPCLVEAEALVKLLGEFPATPAWLSFSCGDESRLCHGEPFAEAIQLANESANIIAVGVNCTPPRFIEGLLAGISSIAKKPLLVYSNSGEAWDSARHCWHGASANADWGENARRWQRAGARLIGGCCRTTPATIRCIAQALR
ncbi:MAG: homocysteine S-methyltransferase [Gemmataceae bacterium]|nr:homocysteine S-methyltransferase [Gemmataceae bacterium]